MPPKPRARLSRSKKKDVVPVFEDADTQDATAQADGPSEPTVSQGDGHESRNIQNPSDSIETSTVPDMMESAAEPRDELAQSGSQQDPISMEDANGQSPASRGFTPINRSQPTKKYQPKAVVRRTQEEREAFEREQALRQSARRGAPATSRGQKPRRGGVERFAGRGRGREARTSQASGIFGGPTIKEKAPRGSKTRPGGGDSQDPELVTSSHEDGEASPSQPRRRTATKVKKEDGNKTAGPEKDDDGDVIMDTSKPRRKTATARTKTKVKVEEPQAGYISDEARWDDDVGPKVEIAKISLLSDEEDDADEDGVRKSYTAASHLRPVRLEREEHQEPDFGINTEASSFGAAEIRRHKQDKKNSDKPSTLPDEDMARILDDVSKVKRKPRDVNFVRAERRWKGVYEDDDDKSERAVKVEPRDDDAMDVDVAPLNEAAPVQPTETEAAPTENEDGLAAESGDRPLRRPKTTGYFHPLPPDAPILLDEEDPDLLEMARIVKEVQEEEEEEAAARGGPNTSKMDPIIHDLSNLKGDPSREGKIYLMQLPPVLPQLRDFAQPPPSTTSGEEGNTDTILPDAPSASSASKPTIKPDPDSKSLPPHILNADSVTSIRLPIGCPGTISFYKSGKIMANWGGLELEVNEQHQAGFAQEVLVHDWQSTQTKIEDGGEWEEVIRVGEEAFAVGEVEGGFIAGPDLGSLIGRGSR